MPSYYRTLPFKALIDAYANATGGVGLVAYQVRRDSRGRGEWFFTQDSDLPYSSYYSSADTTTSERRTGYPLRFDWKIWLNYKPDHILAAGWDSPLSLSAAAYGRLQRAQLGVWIESNSTTSRQQNGLTNAARRVFLRSAKFAVVPTSASAEYVNFLANREMRTVTLKNPVSLKRLSNIEATAMRNRMIFIGDLSERKGFDYFCRAMEVADPDLWSGVAWGRDVDGLATDAPSNLDVRGAVPLQELITQLRHTDVLVIPSRVDPAPLTYSEALALGLRVLVSDRIAYGHDAADKLGSAAVDPADAPAVVSAADELILGPRPDQDRAHEVAPSFWASGVLSAFGL